MNTTVRPLNQHGQPHAIQAARFAIHFSEPLSSRQIDALRGLREKHELLQESFQSVQEIQEMAIQIAAKVSAAPKSGHIGYALDGFSSQGKNIRQLLIQPNLLQYTTTQYTRWSQSWGEVSEVFALLADELVGFNQSISHAALSYDDAFEITPLTASTEWLDLMFQREAKLLPSALFSLSSTAWHNHMGFFEEVSFRTGKVLTNFNIAVRPNPSQEGAGLLSIQSSHRLELASEEKPTLKSITEVMSGLHALHKDHLRSMLSKEIQSQIQLKD